MRHSVRRSSPSQIVKAKKEPISKTLKCTEKESKGTIRDSQSRSAEGNSRTKARSVKGE